MMVALSYGIKMWAEFSFVLSQFTCLTDRVKTAHSKTTAA